MMMIAAISLALMIISSAGVSLPLYLLASAIVTFDGIDILVRLWRRRNASRRAVREPEQAGNPRPYAIVVSIHNMERDIDLLLESLQPYRSKVWIIDDASTDSTLNRVRGFGWRIVASSRNRKKPGAINELLTHLPAEIGTVLVMDPDVRLPADLDARIHAFQHSGAAAMSPKVAVRPDGALAEMQQIEYALSFDLGRHSLSPQAVTSGVAVYDRRVLQEVLQHHSLSVYGEDLENAVTILGNGMDIVYDPKLVLETEGKRELPGLFSQRVGWAFSLFKVFSEHKRDVWNAMRRSPMGFYQFGVYFVVFGMLLWPLKIISIVLLTLSGVNALDEVLALGLIDNNSLNHPSFIAASYIKYTAIVCGCFLIVSPAASIRRSLPLIPFFFFYALFLVIPTTLGYLNWISLRLFGVRLYADHYDADPVLGRERAS